MGDWAEGYFKELGKDPEDRLWLGSCAWHRWHLPIPFRQLCAADRRPHRDAAIAWLTVAGSKEGQDAFNPVKGSIPARSDGDKALYDVYLQSAMDDWATRRCGWFLDPRCGCQ